jgi:hypothetical protein
MKVTKVSEITSSEAAEYLRITELTEADAGTLDGLIEVAKAFMASYTGHTVEELDAYQDFVIVVLVLVQDMWDNRTLYVDNENLNSVIEAILGMHSVNLLPEE